MAKISLNLQDVKKIQDVLEKFPDIERFELHEHGHSGIGCLLDMEFNITTNGVKGTMTVSIVDESQW